MLLDAFDFNVSNHCQIGQPRALEPHIQHRVERTIAHALFYCPPTRRIKYMSLIDLLEQSKTVALAVREEAAAKEAEDVAEFEEFGADLAAAFDQQELEEAEEMLRLGMELDDREEQEVSKREEEDLDLAKHLLEADESTESACAKDELLAKQLEAQERKEALRIAKLEKKVRVAAERKACKGDLAMAEQLAVDIEQEEHEMRERERKDRKLASALVKQESKVLESLPQTEEKLLSMSREINGDAPVPMRTRLFAKLQSLRKGLGDITNKQPIMSPQNGVDGFAAEGTTEC